MKKILSLGVMLGLFLSACSDNKSGSTKIDTSASCHTCFKLDKSQEEAKQKAAHSPNYRFALDNVAIYTSDGKEQIGSITKGYGGEMIKDLGDKVLLEIKGVKKDGDALKLYSTLESELVVVSFTKPDMPLQVAINKSDITDSENQVWSKAEFIYYDNCSMCHAAHAPKEHTIQEWEGIYGTMKAFAMPTDENDAIIWEYLQAHAIDGFALDDEE